MSIKLFGCRKYRRLSMERRDRELNTRELNFLGKHEAVCPPCERTMELGSSVLNMLRAEAMEPEVSPNFDSKVLRMYRVESKRATLRYWSPAVIGAAVAGLVVLAAMQMIAQSSQLPSFKVPTGEARLTKPAIPNLNSFEFNRSWQ